MEIIIPVIIVAAIAVIMSFKDSKKFKSIDARLSRIENKLGI